MKWRNDEAIMKSNVKIIIIIIIIIIINNNNNDNEKW